MAGGDPEHDQADPDETLPRGALAEEDDRERNDEERRRAAREVSVVVAAILGALVLRERHPAGRMAGAAVIFAGLVVIALAH